MGTDDAQLEDTNGGANEQTPVETPWWLEDWVVTLSMMAIGVVVHAMISSFFLGGYRGPIKNAPSGDQIWHTANFFLFVVIASTGVIRSHWRYYAN